MSGLDGMPYGMWICADGSAYLFNRRYQPILFKAPGCKAVSANPDAHVDHVNEVYFWDEATDPRHDICTRHAMQHVRSSFINHIGRGTKAK